MAELRPKSMRPIIYNGHTSLIRPITWPNISIFERNECSQKFLSRLQHVQGPGPKNPTRNLTYRVDPTGPLLCSNHVSEIFMNPTSLKMAEHAI